MKKKILERKLASCKDTMQETMIQLLHTRIARSSYKLNGI